MNNKYFWISLPLISLLIIILNAGRIVDFATDGFWTIVANQLDKEAAEREEKISRGEIVRGKDTVIIWENKYVIYHVGYGKSLFLHNGDTEEMILKGIKKYKIKNDRLYIWADEGYAVIDRDNICKVFITIPNEAFAKGYSIDDNGDEIYNSTKVESQYIEYLSDYSEFNDDEKSMFDKLKK